VNLASAWLLHDSDHDHDHAVPDHSAGVHSAPSAHHHDHHQDSNLRAAYVHVLADALTSVLAIVGLSAAWAFGWTFIDPAVGLVGMIVILSWALSLVRTAGRVLLDTVPDPELARRIRERIEIGGDRLTDLHLWQVGPGHAAMIASVVSDAPQTPSVYKARLEGLAGLSHVTIEVNACPH
jgi:cation diffusion facilitator family transporter